MSSLTELLLRVVVPPQDRRHVLDELDELYAVRAKRDGKPSADRWRNRQIRVFILRALPVFWWKRPLSGFLGLMSNRGGRLGAVDRLRQDLRFAVRSFLRRPAFAGAAILILGLGIGAATTIYSVVDTVMLKPLPYPQAGQLVHFGGYGGYRPQLFTRWRDNLESYQGIGAAWNVALNLTGEGPPQRIRVSRVTPDLLPILGATPHMGRLFLEDDFQDIPPVALLSFGFWQRNWGGDPSLLGRTIQVDGRGVTVAGVLGPDFTPPEAVTGKQVDVWLPFRVEAEESFGWNILSVVGRLKEGVGLAGAQEEIRALTENLAPELPGLLLRQDGSVRITRLIPLQISTFRSVAGPLLFLMWSVFLMLLIACANLANLLLAHGTSRARELALRGAVGASRGRIVRQLLTESITLAVAGGLLGVGLAYLGVEFFVRATPGGVPRIEEVAVNPRVLFFALVASVSTGLIFGTMPALHASRRDVAAALQEGGTASSSARRGKRTRSVLVMGEMALALILLSSAGLFFKSLVTMARVDPGFRTEHLVSVPLHLGAGYDGPQRIQFTRMVKERLEGIPGVQAVAAGLTVPFEYVGASRCCMSNDVSPVGGPMEADPLPPVQVHPVTPGYFRTLGAEIASGREFAAADEEGEGLVTVLNEPTARHFFGDEDPVGRSLHVDGWGVVTVVGVARGVRHWGPDSGIGPALYVPWARWGSFSDIYKLIIRSNMDLAVLSPVIREAIWAVDPSLPVEEIVPTSQRVESAIAGRRFLTLLLGTFAGLSLLLATGGIYASMLHNVGQRRKEMGIRLAVGAGGRQLVRLVLASALFQVAVGVGFGLAGSIAVSSILRRWLFGVALADGTTLASVVALLAGSALLASLFPALKAARTDPLETLKVE